MHERSAARFDGIDYAPGRKFRAAREGLKLTGYSVFDYRPPAGSLEPVDDDGGEAESDG